MSSRIPSLPKEELNDEQQEFFDWFIASVKKKAPHPGAAERASKTLFPVLAVIPDVGKLSVDLLARLEDNTPQLPAYARETAALYTTTYFKSAYVTKIHSMNAVKLELLTQAQADTITAGEKPEDLDQERSLAYDIAEHLLAVRGPLSDALYDRGLEVFGREGIVALMHLVSLMAWTAMGLNVADVPPPQPPAKESSDSK